METPRDPTASRYEHAAHGLRRRDLDPDPIKQFSNWFTAAIEAEIRDVNAMSLATAGRDGVDRPRRRSRDSLVHVTSIAVARSARSCTRRGRVVGAHDARL